MEEFTKKYNQQSIFTGGNFRVPLERRGGSWWSHKKIEYLGSNKNWHYLKETTPAYTMKSTGSETIKYKTSVHASDDEQFIAPRKYAQYNGSHGKAVATYSEHGVEIIFSDFELDELVSLPCILDRALFYIDGLEKIRVNGKLSLSSGDIDLHELIVLKIGGMVDVELTLSEKMVISVVEN